MKRPISFTAIVAAITASLVAGASVWAADTAATYKVFIYAGQSNARGKAPNKIADAQLADPAVSDSVKDLYGPLRKDGKWIVRDDAFFNWEAQMDGVHGPVTMGMGSYRGGGDYMFASMMADHFDEPVVISKSAFGGSTLFHDFRPPSAGLPGEAELQKQLTTAQNRAKALNERNKTHDPLPTMDDIKKEYGFLYRQIIADYRKLTENAETWFPQLKGRAPELVGFVWFQGWNDQYGGAEEYAANMKCFIKDMRNDLDAPNLPFVIAAMGQNGSKPAAGAMLTIRDAQMSMNDVPEFHGNVKAFRSDLLVDKEAERLHATKDPLRKVYVGDAGYHYFGSPIWYTRIGRVAGEAMLEMLSHQSK